MPFSYELSLEQLFSHDYSIQLSELLMFIFSAAVFLPLKVMGAIL